MDKNLVLHTSVALKHAPLSIKPFLNGRKNMGLETYNMVMHNSIWHTDQVICKVDGHTKTYITGLNENAAEVQNLQGERKAAKIASIRRLVAKAERLLIGNQEVDPEQPDIENDKEFWKRVKRFHSVVPDVFNNQGVRVPTYWDELTIKLNNDGIILDENDVKSELIVSCIEAGGFCMIAPDYETARTSPKEYKFYIDKKGVTATTKNGERLLRDRAGSRLLALRDGDATKLFYITKIVSEDSTYFREGKNSPTIDTLYEEVSNYLDGKASETSKKRACDSFLELEKMNLSELKARAMFKDGLQMRFIVLNDNNYLHIASQTIIGGSEEEAVIYLKNPANAKKVYDRLIEQVTNLLNK